MAFPALFLKKQKKSKNPKIETYTIEEFNEKQRQKKIGYLIRFGAVVIWGINPIIFKYSPASDVSVFVRVFLFFGGGILLSLFSLFFLKKSILFKSYKVPFNAYLVSMSIGLAMLTFVMMESLQYTSGTTFILLNNFAPMFAILVALILWKNEIPYLRNRSNILKIIILFFIGGIGSSLLFYNDLTNGKDESLLGNIGGLIYMILDVGLIISQIKYSKLIKDGQSYFVNLYVFGLGFLLLFPVLFLSYQQIFTLSLNELFWLLSVGVLWGIGALLNYEAFRRMDGFIAFLMFNISILITFSIEAYILNEIPATWMLFLGGTLITGSSIFAEKINTKCEKEQIQK